MKILKGMELAKYSDLQKYEQVDEFIYWNKQANSYNITIYCELEKEENTQYPLEDLLDKYYVHCTEHLEEKYNEECRVLEVELEGSLENPVEDFKNITAISKLIGCRAYNKEKNGRICLIIE